MTYGFHILSVTMLMGDKMPISRQFEIVYLLLKNNKMSTKELASHFEVSSRTIVRDLDSILAAGIPLISSFGRNGGICLDDSYVLDKAIISDQQKQDILSSLQSVASIGGVDVSEMLKKFEMFFGETSSNWLEIDFSRWGDEKDNEKYIALKEAIPNKKELEFVYYSSYGKKTSRIVYPLKLVFKGNGWYLQAYCLKARECRTFKVNRMHELVVKEEYENIEVEVMPIDSGEVQDFIEVKLLFSKDIAYRVYDEFDICDIMESDNSILVTSKIPHDGWIYGFVLSCGNGVEVISPEKLKHEVIEMAGSILKKYDM